MTHRARVLFDIHPRTVGGTEQFLARLLPRLDRSRFEAIAVSSHAGPPLRALTALGIQTATVPAFFSQQGVFRLAELITKTGVALVQSNYYSSQLALAARAAAVPHVWRLGGHVAYGSRAKTKAHVRSTLNAIRLLSSAIICNSEYVRGQFEERSGKPAIQVIYNGVTRARAARRLRRATSVAMAAHFTPQKRHEDFVRAAARVRLIHPEASFTVLGEAYGHNESRRYARKIRRLALSLVKANGMIFSKFPAADRDTWQGSDLVVLTSIGESSSNALLEAMAAGIPVVAVRSGGTPELIVHRRTGLLVPPRAPRALASAVAALLADPARCARFGRAARRRAHTRFSMTRCVRRYEAFYARVIRGAAIS